MSPSEFTQVCRGYVERRRTAVEVAWQTAAFVGMLFSSKGLRPLDELHGPSVHSGRQSDAQMDLMLQMFSAQVKTPIRKPTLN